MLAVTLSLQLLAIPAPGSPTEAPDLRDPLAVDAGLERGRPGVGARPRPDLRDPLALAPSCAVAPRTTANGVPLQRPRAQGGSGCIRQPAPPLPEADLRDPFQVSS